MGRPFLPLTTNTTPFEVLWSGTLREAVEMPTSAVQAHAVLTGTAAASKEWMARRYGFNKDTMDEYNVKMAQEAKDNGLETFLKLKTDAKLKHLKMADVILIKAYTSKYDRHLNGGLREGILDPATLYHEAAMNASLAKLPAVAGALQIIVG